LALSEVSLADKGTAPDLVPVQVRDLDEIVTASEFGRALSTPTNQLAEASSRKIRQPGTDYANGPGRGTAGAANLGRFTPGGDWGSPRE
jgi:hypothetical protein